MNELKRTPFLEKNMRLEEDLARVTYERDQLLTELLKTRTQYFDLKDYIRKNVVNYSLSERMNI